MLRPYVKRTPRNPRVVAFVKKYGNRNLRDPEKIIVHLAKKLMRRVHSGAPPFLPEAIIQACNVKEIITKDFMLVDASLVDKGDYYLIYTAAGIPWGRRNFSVFHEIAHTFFIDASKEHKPFLTAAENELLKIGYQEEERLCNIAAAECLLPAQPFRERLKGMDMNWESVRALATTFGASFEATIRRLGEFYDGSLLVMRWRMVNDNFVPAILACSPDLKRFAGRLEENSPPVPVATAFESGKSRTSSSAIFLKGRHVPFTVELRYHEKHQEILALYIPIDPRALGT